MVSSINKQLLLTAYAYLFIMEQQKGQGGSEALQVEKLKNAEEKLQRVFSNFSHDVSGHFIVRWSKVCEKDPIPAKERIIGDMFEMAEKRGECLEPKADMIALKAELKAKKQEKFELHELRREYNLLKGVAYMAPHDQAQASEISHLKKEIAQARQTIAQLEEQTTNNQTAQSGWKQEELQQIKDSFASDEEKENQQNPGAKEKNTQQARNLCTGLPDTVEGLEEEFLRLPQGLRTVDELKDWQSVTTGKAVLRATEIEKKKEIIGRITAHYSHTLKWLQGKGDGRKMPMARAEDGLQLVLSDGSIGKLVKLTFGIEGYKGGYTSSQIKAIEAEKVEVLEERSYRDDKGRTMKEQVNHWYVVECTDGRWRSLWRNYFYLNPNFVDKKA